MSKSTAPPLGVIPAPIWRMKICVQRIHDIIDAIIRYREAGMDVPDHWYRELGTVTQEKLDAEHAYNSLPLEVRKEGTIPR